MCPGGMPELHWESGYRYVWILILAVVRSYGLNGLGAYAHIVMAYMLLACVVMAYEVMA